MQQGSGENQQQIKTCIWQSHVDVYSEVLSTVLLWLVTNVNDHCKNSWPQSFCHFSFKCRILFLCGRAHEPKQVCGPGLTLKYYNICRLVFHTLVTICQMSFSYTSLRNMHKTHTHLRAHYAGFHSNSDDGQSAHSIEQRYNTQHRSMLYQQITWHKFNDEMLQLLHSTYIRQENRRFWSVYLISLKSFGIKGSTLLVPLTLHRCCSVHM